MQITTHKTSIYALTVSERNKQIFPPFTSDVLCCLGSAEPADMLAHGYIPYTPYILHRVHSLTLSLFPTLPLRYLVVTHLVGQHLLGVHEFWIVVGARTPATGKRIMIRSGQQQIVQVLSLLGTDVCQLNRDRNGIYIDH